MPAAKVVFGSVTAVLLAATWFLVAQWIPDMQVALSPAITDFEVLAERMNVRNLVAVVYLGPRVLDTFLEVNVVILTVFGMKFIRSTS